TLARWFAYEAARVYSIVRESAEERDARRLMEFIRARGGMITTRTLQRSNTSRYPSPESAEAALEILATAGLAEWVDSPPGPKGGRPSRALRLKPDTPTDNTDKTPDDGDDDDDSCGLAVLTEPPTEPPSPCENPREKQGFVSIGSTHTQSEGPDSAPPGPEQ